MLAGWLAKSLFARSGRQHDAVSPDRHAMDLPGSASGGETLAMIGKTLIAAIVLIVGMAAPFTFRHKFSNDSAPPPATATPVAARPIRQDRRAGVIRGRERGTTPLAVCPESLVRSTSRSLCRAKDENTR